MSSLFGFGSPDANKSKRIQLKRSEDETNNTDADCFLVGDRVRISGTGKGGTCRFLGTSSFGSGYWAGIELATADGTCDGSVEGERYFGPTKRNHAIFVKAELCSKLKLTHPPSPSKGPPAFSSTLLVSNNAMHMLKKSEEGSPSSSPSHSPSSSPSKRDISSSQLLRRSAVSQTPVKISASPAAPSSSSSGSGGPSPSVSASLSAGEAREIKLLRTRVDALEQSNREMRRSMDKILRYVQQLDTGNSPQQTEALTKIAELAKVAQAQNKKGSSAPPSSSHSVGGKTRH